MADSKDAEPSINLGHVNAQDAALQAAAARQLTLADTTNHSKTLEHDDKQPLGTGEYRRLVDNGCDSSSADDDNDRNSSIDEYEYNELGAEDGDADEEAGGLEKAGGREEADGREAEVDLRSSCGTADGDEEEDHDYYDDVDEDGEEDEDDYEGDDDEEEEEEEEEDGGGRVAFAVDPSQLTKCDGLPQNGHDYLRLVQMERAKYPKTIEAPSAGANTANTAGQHEA